MLYDSTTLTDLKQELNHYFKTNTTTDSDPLFVWEAHKPVFRGILIKHGSRIKKEREAETERLLSAIAKLEP